MSEPISQTPHEFVTQALRRLWWVPLLRGVLLIVLGGYALIYPDMAIGALAILIGIFVIADGTLAVLVGIMGEVPSRMWIIVRGIIGVLVGLFVVANPLLVSGITATILLYLLAFSAIACGVLEIISAIQDRQYIEGAGWLGLAGILTVIFGILILLAPLTFGLLIVRLLGIFAMISGVSLIIFAFQVRRLGKFVSQSSLETGD